MKAVGLILLLLFLSAPAASLSPLEEATLISPNGTTHHYNGTPLPRPSQGVHTLYWSDLPPAHHTLYLPPSPYPCILHIGSDTLYSRGSLETSTTLANYAATTVPLPAKSLSTGNDTLKIHFYSDGQSYPFPIPRSGAYHDVRRRSEIITFFNSRGISAIVLASFISALLYFSLALTGRTIRRDLLWFSLFLCALSLSYINFLFNADIANELLLFKISRSALIYLITLLFFYVTEHLALLRDSRIKISLLILTIPFVLYILGADSKNSINHIYLKATVYIYRPLLFVMLFLYLYRVFHKKEKRHIISFAGFLIVLFAMLRDAHCLKNNLWPSQAFGPDFWLIPYGYLVQSLSIIITLTISEKHFIASLARHERTLSWRNSLLEKKEQKYKDLTAAYENYALYLCKIISPAVKTLSTLNHADDDEKDKSRENHALQRLNFCSTSLEIYRTITRTGLTPAPRSVDIRAVFNTVIREYSRRVRSKNLSLIPIFYDILIPQRLYTDSNLAEFILSALLEDITEKTDTGGITAKLDYNNGRLIFEISSTSTRATKFFYTPNRENTGTFSQRCAEVGIPLAAVEEVLTALHGTLHFIGNEDEPKTFIAEIPAPPAEAEHTPRGARCTVLVADPHKITRTLLAEQLRALGNHVLTAESEEEAARILRSTKVPVLFIDSSFSAARDRDALRRLTRSNPPLFTAGLRNSDDTETILPRSIPKPVNHEDLRILMEDALSLQ
ncbi:MAG: hypothetical protein ACQEQV_03340 [Fibrobacterota bacterium]